MERDRETLRHTGQLSAFPSISQPRATPPTCVPTAPPDTGQHTGGCEVLKVDPTLVDEVLQQVRTVVVMPPPSA
ncbi:MAG: hypothetical protein RSB86_02715 [Comamonas sp.]